MFVSKHLYFNDDIPFTQNFDFPYPNWHYPILFPLLHISEYRRHRYPAFVTFRYHSTLQSLPQFSIPQLVKMSIKFFLITSRQGKLRLSKWFTNNLSTSTTNTAISSGDSSTSAGNSASQKEKAKIIKDVTTAVLNRKTRMCNVVEYKDFKVIYRRWGGSVDVLLT